MPVRRNRVIIHISSDDTIDYVSFSEFGSFGWVLRGRGGWVLRRRFEPQCLMCISHAREFIKKFSAAKKGRWKILSAEETAILIVMNT